MGQCIGFSSQGTAVQNPPGGGMDGPISFSRVSGIHGWPSYKNFVDTHSNNRFTKELG